MQRRAARAARACAAPRARLGVVRARERERQEEHARHRRRRRRAAGGGDPARGAGASFYARAGLACERRGRRRRRWRRRRLLRLLLEDALRLVGPRARPCVRSTESPGISPRRARQEWRAGRGGAPARAVQSRQAHSRSWRALLVFFFLRRTVMQPCWWRCARGCHAPSSLSPRAGRSARAPRSRAAPLCRRRRSPQARAAPAPTKSTPAGQQATGRGGEEAGPEEATHTCTRRRRRRRPPRRRRGHLPRPVRRAPRVRAGVRATGRWPHASRGGPAWRACVRACVRVAACVRAAPRAGAAARGCKHAVAVVHKQGARQGRVRHATGTQLRGPAAGHGVRAAACRQRRR
eukprot:scaffold1942_cov351-Prasinococcus_capsulatus_cf.AAC.14